MTFTKKGAPGRLFLCLLAFTTNLPLAVASPAVTRCPSKQFDEISSVRYVHDGDTLHLVDGRKVRLIGINTPELARDKRPAEAFAADSKNSLRSLFAKDKSIALVFGRDKKDHYGRLLAHAFLPDGSNVQAVLLQQGLASAITVPPNLRFAACYFETEQAARCHKAGLWQSADILPAGNLDRQATGFRLIKGTVRDIETNAKGIWLNLDHKLTVGIRSENLKLFDKNTINSMLNQTIVVRGWVNKSNRSRPFYLRVRHPLSIQLLAAFNCH